MSFSFVAWRRHLWIWVLPLGFCLVNLFGILVYRYAFAGKVETLEQQYQASADRLAERQSERQLIDTFLGKVETHQEGVRGLYSDHFQTERQRFTRVVQDIKTLARQAGLRPDAFSYPRKGLADLELVERSIKFTVTGTYDQLRRFINFLELSDHFVALNSVTLGESGGNQSVPTLRINLVLTTVFATREAENAEVEKPTEEPTT